MFKINDGEKYCTIHERFNRVFDPLPSLHEINRCFSHVCLIDSQPIKTVVCDLFFRASA